MTCWRQPGNAYSASLVDTASIHWEFALERGEALRWDKTQVTMKAGLSSLLLSYKRFLSTPAAHC